MATLPSGDPHGEKLRKIMAAAGRDALSAYLATSTNNWTVDRDIHLAIAEADMLYRSIAIST